MKNLSSISSSSSNVNSLSYNGPSPGCSIARIIRRILCMSTVPSYPFDHFKDEENVPLVPAASGAPGIVARLMGLEFAAPNEPITRNPSTNSIDSFRKSGSSNPKTISSTYQEFEDENFFILSFDQEDENIEFIPSNPNSTKMMRAKCKKKKKKKNRRRTSIHQEWNKENEGVNEVLEDNSEKKVYDLCVKNPSIVVRPLKNSCEKSHLSERFRKIKAKQDNLGVVKFEKECDSENSSPNSVLDFLKFPPDPETASSGNISRLGNSKSRRTLSEELDNFRKTKERKLIKDGCGEEKKHTRLRNTSQNYAEIWDEIGKLAARELIKSSWLGAEISKNHHHFKEIGRDLAVEILDQLLEDLLINLH